MNDNIACSVINVGNYRVYFILIIMIDMSTRLEFRYLIREVNSGNLLRSHS